MHCGCSNHFEIWISDKAIKLDNYYMAYGESHEKYQCNDRKCVCVCLLSFIKSNLLSNLASVSFEQLQCQNDTVTIA